MFLELKLIAGCCVCGVALYFLHDTQCVHIAGRFMIINKQNSEFSFCCLLSFVFGLLLVHVDKL